MEKREREREYLHKEKPPPLYIDHCHFRKKKHQPDAASFLFACFSHARAENHLLREAQLEVTGDSADAGTNHSMDEDM